MESQPVIHTHSYTIGQLLAIATVQETHTSKASPIFDRAIKYLFRLFFSPLLFFFLNFVSFYCRSYQPIHLYPLGFVLHFSSTLAIGAKLAPLPGGRSSLNVRPIFSLSLLKSAYRCLVFTNARSELSSHESIVANVRVLVTFKRDSIKKTGSNDFGFYLLPIVDRSANRTARK